MFGIVLFIETVGSVSGVRRSPGGFGEVLIHHDLFYPAERWLRDRTARHRKWNLFIFRIESAGRNTVNKLLKDAVDT